MEYPKHYRVDVRVLAEITDEDRCGYLQDEIERQLVWDSKNEEFDEDVLNQRVRENKEREQQELEERLDRTIFGIKDEDVLKDSIKSGLRDFGDGTCDWKPVDNYSYKQIDELISERLNNSQLIDLKLIQDKSNDIVNHPHLTKDQKKDLLYNLNNLNHHIYASIDILKPDTILYSKHTMIGIDHLLKLENRNPNYRASSALEYNEWILEWRKSPEGGMDEPRWWIAFINLKSSTRSSSIKEVQDLLKDYRKRKDTPTGESVIELFRNLDNDITEYMDIVLGQISSHIKNQHPHSKASAEYDTHIRDPINQTEEEIIQYYLESYPDPDARGKLPI